MCQASCASSALSAEVLITSCAMQELGYPWVMRKAMIKYGSKSTDIIKTKGSTMKIVTVNAKGSWTRVLDTEKAEHQVLDMTSCPKDHGNRGH